MARVTIEDCLRSINNRFELAVLAGFRAKQIEKGSLSNMDKKNDKCAVVALREIADKRHDVDSLRDAYVYGLRKNVLLQDVLEEETSFVETAKDSMNTMDFENIDASQEAIEEAISVENLDFEDDED